jgi:hypothetical protein
MDEVNNKNTLNINNNNNENNLEENENKEIKLKEETKLNVASTPTVNTQFNLEKIRV